jgi:two-component system, NarL family, response regulator
MSSTRERKWMSALRTSESVQQKTAHATSEETHETNRPLADTFNSIITVLVADDHPVIREGYLSLFKRVPTIRVVAEAANGIEAVASFLRLTPDVGLIDLRMPVMDGIATVSDIRSKLPQASLVVVTTYECEEDIYRALRAGARGFMLKNAAVEELVECVRVVAGGGTWIPPAVGAKLAKRVTNRELTPRELQVLETIVMGKSNKEVGVVFNITEATVKVHVTHILDKLKVTGRTEAINVAIKRGLVRLSDAAA